MRATGHPSSRISRATDADIQAVARLVAVAFDDLVVTEWLVPTRRQRSLVMPGYFEIMVEHAIEQGMVEVTSDLSAAAVWIPAGFPEAPKILDYDRRLAETCGPYVDRFRALDTVMDECHPKQPHHDYLALLAVHPEWQGLGLGSALLSHRLKELDRLARPAYLEAASLRSRKLYQRHGFNGCGGPFAPGDCHGAMWPMWRRGTSEL